MNISCLGNLESLVQEISRLPCVHVCKGTKTLSHTQEYVPCLNFLHNNCMHASHLYLCFAS